MHQGQPQVKGPASQGDAVQYLDDNSIPVLHDPKLLVLSVTHSQKIHGLLVVQLQEAATNTPWVLTLFGHV